LHAKRLGARALIPAALAAALLVGATPAAPVETAQAATARRGTEAWDVIQLAKRQLGDPWRYGRTGPNAFDCSGLVIYTFKHTGNSSVIGKGKYRSARALYAYFKRRHLASKSGGRPGDLVIWGGGTHVGIYLGNGKAISTLTRGVRIHGVRAVRARFTAYLHTGLWKKSSSTVRVAAAAPVAPTPTPVLAQVVRP
jgi:cell wall-associated NlpC family hydrolase